MLETVQGTHSPVDNLGRQCVVFFLAIHSIRKSSDVLLDRLELTAEVELKAGMEALVENLVHNPTDNDGPSDCGHLLFPRLDCVGTNITLDPRWQRAPVLADVKGEIVDGAVESIEPGRILAVVKRRSRLRHTLVRNGIL